MTIHFFTGLRVFEKNMWIPVISDSEKRYCIFKPETGVLRINTEFIPINKLEEMIAAQKRAPSTEVIFSDPETREQVLSIRDVRKIEPMTQEEKYTMNELPRQY